MAVAWVAVAAAKSPTAVEKLPLAKARSPSAVDEVPVALARLPQAVALVPVGGPWAGWGIEPAAEVPQTAPWAEAGGGAAMGGGLGGGGAPGPLKMLSKKN